MTVFGMFKGKATPTFAEVRKLLFGDVPLAEWKAQGGQGDSEAPWSTFEEVRAAVARGAVDAAVVLLRQVLDTPGLEARQRLQAWYFLRQFGVEPHAPEAKRVYGVVLEVHLSAGLDTLAAYSDNTARYLNHGGRLIVWENADDAMTSHIGTLIGLGQRVTDAIGRWEQPRPPAPPKGHARLNMLTPAGLHFGEGPLVALSADPMAGPLIAAGANLMRALIDRDVTA